MSSIQVLVNWKMILMSPCPLFSNDGTTPVIWAVSSYPGWMPIFVSLFNNCHESKLLFGGLVQLLSLFLWQWPYSCYLAILGSCHILLIDLVSCSELFFGRLEPWLSYFSNVPDLSCKNCSGGYWFICRFSCKSFGWSFPNDQNLRGVKPAI